ncbi:NAD(P)/FAD-dependent oxidoreductase [Sphingomonas sp. PB4P5]|uniref:NAD(P)/FAD-dependent oxidoreductase n=1 Tax=Parasphingomonas puruogangriensis TaxID=3096155 RepID=UPI002FC68367
MARYDIAIIGAGIAGAGLAAAIGELSAGRVSVLLLESETTPGYHATGRSAAFWSESYGGPGVQPLTTASGPALQEGGFLEPLGSLHIGRAADATKIDAFLEQFAGSGVALTRVDPRPLVPGLHADWELGVMEASSAYIDVAALHADCLARARRSGTSLVTAAPLRAADRGWRLKTKAGVFEADVLVNAAGAWADAVAVLAGIAPLGIQPYRRTMVQVRTDPPTPATLPHVSDISGDFYFKPEGDGRLWLSPHDETPVDPHDVQPEELDVAIAIDRFERAGAWRAAAVERRWAGLRSFAPDRLPVYGFEPGRADFFWCAGQGGFGIQTAPAGAALAAGLLLGVAPEPFVAAIDPAVYAPGRFRF